MSDEFPQIDAEEISEQLDIYIDLYGARPDISHTQVNEAMDIVFRAIYATHDIQLHKYFSGLRDAVAAELRQDNPDLDNCRLRMEAWNSYYRAAHVKSIDRKRSLKEAVLTQLERNLPRHLRREDLFLTAIVQELDCTHMLEHMPPFPECPRWEHFEPNPAMEKNANEPF